MIFREQAERFARGDLIDNPHGAIVMYARCAARKWAHLPVAGGMYDQDPELLRYWDMIDDAIARHEKARRKQEENKAKASQRRGRR